MELSIRWQPTRPQAIQLTPLDVPLGGRRPTIVTDPPPFDPDKPFPGILGPDPIDPAPQTKEEIRALAGTLPAAAGDFDWLYRLLSTPVASSSLYLSTPAEHDIGTLAAPSSLP